MAPDDPPPEKHPAFRCKKIISTGSNTLDVDCSGDGMKKKTQTNTDI